jgi:tetratricopeptide (TPR) repeat protein
MESYANPRPALWTLPRSLAVRRDPPALAAWTLAFTLVAYLALRNGGYDTVVRSEVAVAVWWLVLLTALAGMLPARIGAAGWVAIALLAAFAAWTGLAIGWSESAERSSIELGRVAAHLGVLVLAIALQGRTAARTTINGVACAIGFVTALAVLSRLHPQAFPANEHFEFLGPGSARKLSYPLNYWNALAAFAAMGGPLLLAVAIGARTLAGQALAALALPLSTLCIYLTISRGGMLALAVGLVAFVALVPRRLEAAGTLALAGAGSAVLLWGLSLRDALQQGTVTPTGLHQGTQMLWIAVFVCGGVALLQVALGLAARHAHRPPVLEPGRRAMTRRSLAALAAVAVVAVAAGVPARVADTWRDFKAPNGVVAAGSEDNVFSRLQAANGNGRYEFWQAALNANATDPWRGIGPGTFEFWWARHSTTPGFVRDAHTLYLETLAETGIVGFALLAGFLLWLAAVALVRTLRAPETLRLWTAAAAGGLAAFLTSAAFEWVWEMAALAMAAMLLAAIILAGRDDPLRPREPDPARADSWVARGVLAALALAALVAVLVPLASTLATRDSRAAAARGRLDVAYADSQTAQRLQPYGATPHLQQALVLEQSGFLSPAARAARAATREEPTNWRTWLVLARLDARRGAMGPALEELRQAQRLNPRSTLFAPQ